MGTAMTLGKNCRHEEGEVARDAGQQAWEGGEAGRAWHDVPQVGEGRQPTQEGEGRWIWGECQNETWLHRLDKNAECMDSHTVKAKSHETCTSCNCQMQAARQSQVHG